MSSVVVPLASTRQPYTGMLLALWSLFCLRVLGQVLVMFKRVTFLPAKEEWFSGLMPYPKLLVSQILIILVYGRVCFDLTVGSGWFAVPSAGFGRGLLRFGCAYLGLMLVRYVIRMSLYSKERWVGGCIPIFFHWVLSLFLVVLGLFNLEGSSNGLSGRAVLLTLGRGWIALVLPGILLWAAYMMAPSIFGWCLSLGRSTFAVRVEKQVRISGVAGGEVLVDLFRPYRTIRTPAILLQLMPPNTFRDDLWAGVIAKMWAERGYTVGIVRAPSLAEEVSEWLKRQDWFDGRKVIWTAGMAREVIGQIRQGRLPGDECGCPTSRF